MRVTTLTPFKTDPSVVRVDDNGCINPFHQDLFNMGTQIGRNVTIMYSNFDDQECSSFIIVNNRTGERILIENECKCVKCGSVGYDSHHFMTAQGNVCPKCVALPNGETEREPQLADAVQASSPPPEVPKLKAMNIAAAKAYLEEVTGRTYSWPKLKEIWKQAKEYLADDKRLEIERPFEEYLLLAQEICTGRA